MPYPGEFAPYKSLHRLAESEKVKELLGEYELRSPTVVSASLDKLPIEKLPTSQWQPNWVLAIDGSHHEVQVKNGFPGAEASYVTVASVLLDLAKIKELDQHRPVDPKVFRTTQEAESIDWAFPGCNVISKGEASAKDSLRKKLFDVFASMRMTEESESLLDTYEALLVHKPSDEESRQQQHCPDDECQHKFLRNQGKYVCNCEKGCALYSTDALRIHEGMSPAGTNGAVFGEIMQVLERIWVLHILRTMEQQKWLPSLGKLAIVIDGPLAVFGHPAWLSQAIFKELTRLNKAVRAATNGQDLLLIGVEKTGEFVDHFALIDTDEKGVTGELFPKRSVALLTNSYINQNVIFSDSQRFYGRQSYFGRKLLYKTSSGARIVATLPFLSEEHKDLNNAEIFQFPRLVDAVRLLDQLVSSRYPNALSPLVAANAEAAIPLHLGKKVLERLAKELITGSR